MPKAPAHPKLTGGGGFRFEDQVVAFHLAHMLANRPVLGADVGTIHRLTFMARPLGWFLDDMLIEFRGGSVHVAAVSIKSNRQITSGGVPENFVGDAWAQFLGEAELSFVEGDDLLVLATSPLGMEVHADFHELVRWSIHQRNEDVKAHVAQEGVGSPIKRQLFESLRCPAEPGGKVRDPGGRHSQAHSLPAFSRVRLPGRTVPRYHYGGRDLPLLFNER